MTVFKTPKQHKKSAAEGGRLLRLFFRLLYSHFLEVQNKIYTYWVYLMEHIFFGVQLCIKISIFNEKSNFWYSDHPEITPGLHVPPARRGAPPPGPPDGSAAPGPRPPTPPARRPPGPPLKKVFNIGANMDRTIHYFQDRTDIWIVRSNISRIGLINSKSCSI